MKLVCRTCISSVACARLQASPPSHVADGTQTQTSLHKQRKMTYRLPPRTPIAAGGEYAGRFAAGEVDALIGAPEELLFLRCTNQCVHLSCCEPPCVFTSSSDRRARRQSVRHFSLFVKGSLRSISHVGWRRGLKPSTCHVADGTQTSLHKQRKMTYRLPPRTPIAAGGEYAGRFAAGEVDALIGAPEELLKRLLLS